MAARKIWRGPAEARRAQIAQITPWPDPRALFQLGYNLGRLSELTGLGRAPFWDRWKDAVTRWDRPELERLARQLQAESASWPRALPETPDPARA